jgi:hypothetical protein
MKPPEKDGEGRSRRVQADREARLARALRANLKRRKAMVRTPPAPRKPDSPEL